MRGNDIPAPARREISGRLRELATGQFEHRILADGVHDDVVEDGQLAQLMDAAVTAGHAVERREAQHDTVDADTADAAAAAERLRQVAETRVLEICAERCFAVLDDGHVWVEKGWEDRDDMRTAQQEAAAWLCDHRDVCVRVLGDGPETVAATARVAEGSA